MRNEGTTETATLEATLSEENVRAAWLAVKANGGAPGVDGRDIEATAEHLRTHWDGIRAKLLTGAYKPGAVRAVDIPKANGGTRRLGIPNVQDRMVQQAIHRMLSPLWEAEFSAHSHGFRPGRSAHNAVREAQGYVREGKTWVVDIDLKGFFDEVNHDILMRQVALKVRDKRLLRLIGEYLRAPMQFPDRTKEKRLKGTPQGGPLSPLLANIYLDPLDCRSEAETTARRAARRVAKPSTSWRRANSHSCATRTTSRSSPQANVRRPASSNG